MAITLGPVIGLVLNNAVVERERQADEVQEGNVRFLRLIGDEEERWVESTRQLLFTLSLLPEILDTTQCPDLMQDLRSQYPLYANLAVAMANGTVTCSAVPFQGHVTVNNRTWFQRTVQSDAFSVGDYQVGTLSDRPVLNFGHPVRNPLDELLAVVYASVDLRWLNDRLSQAELPTGAVLLLLDSNATLLARFPEREDLVGQRFAETPLVQEVLARQEGSVETAGIDGVKRFYAFQPLHASSAGDAANFFAIVGVPAAAAYAEINRAFFLNVVTLAVVAAVGLVAAWSVGTRSVVRRVDQLVDTAHRLSRGELDARTRIPHNEGELGQLARAVDEMAGSLKRLVAKERLLDELQKKEAELGQLFLQIMKLNRELHGRNEELDEFAHAISHDLKAPLRAINNLARWIEEEEGDRMSSESRSNLQRLRNRVQRLGAMIDGVLAYARAVRGDDQAEPLQVDKLLRETVEILAPPPGMKVEIQPGALRLVAPPARLQQVFQNLVANAIKYHHQPEKGHVRIGWNEQERHVDFWVADDGPGIPSEAHERIFRLFETVGGEKATDSTGIGLAVVKRIVENEGGHIGVESQPGRGSTFLFTWPKRDVGARADPTVLERPPLGRPRP